MINTKQLSTLTPTGTSDNPQPQNTSEKFGGHQKGGSDVSVPILVNEGCTYALPGHAALAGDHGFKWTAELSPFKPAFAFHDPHRRGRSLQVDRAGAPHISEEPPLDELTPCFRLTWPETLAVLHRVDAELGVYFDPDDGDCLISGYALYEAGVITADCEVAGGLLNEEERKVYALSANPAVAEVAAEVMRIYCHILTLIRDRDRPLFDMLQAGLLEWIKPAIEAPTPGAAGVSAFYSKVHDLFRRAYEIRCLGASSVPANEGVINFDSREQAEQFAKDTAPYLIRTEKLAATQDSKAPLSPDQDDGNLDKDKGCEDDH